MFSFFIDRVRANLHIVLCFSPVGPKLNARTQKFPALINGCTVDWYLPWPEEALKDVARHFMGLFEIQDKDAETVRNALINHMGSVHKMVDDGTQLFFERYRRKTYVTPRSYLGFIGTRQSRSCLSLDLGREPHVCTTACCSRRRMRVPTLIFCRCDVVPQSYTARHM